MQAKPLVFRWSSSESNWKADSAIKDADGCTGEWVIFVCDDGEFLIEAPTDEAKMYLHVSRDLCHERFRDAIAQCKRAEKEIVFRQKAAEQDQSDLIVTNLPMESIDGRES